MSRTHLQRINQVHNGSNHTQVEQCKNAKSSQYNLFSPMHVDYCLFVKTCPSHWLRFFCFHGFHQQNLMINTVVWYWPWFCTHHFSYKLFLLIEIDFIRIEFVLVHSSWNSSMAHIKWSSVVYFWFCFCFEFNLV